MFLNKTTTAGHSFYIGPIGSFSTYHNYNRWHYQQANLIEVVTKEGYIVYTTYHNYNRWHYQQANLIEVVTKEGYNSQTLFSDHLY
jgi:phage pi2 protein 07